MWVGWAWLPPGVCAGDDDAPTDPPASPRWRRPSAASEEHILDRGDSKAFPISRQFQSKKILSILFLFVALQSNFTFGTRNIVYSYHEKHVSNQTESQRETQL